MWTERDASPSAPCGSHAVARRKGYRTLHTAKRRDFEKFALCVEMVAAGSHLTREGLIEIAEIVETMNRQKPRADLIGILRGHTPEVQDTGS